jgi:hypothetical protein
VKIDNEDAQKEIFFKKRTEDKSTMLYEAIDGDIKFIHASGGV